MDILTYINTKRLEPATEDSLAFISHYMHLRGTPYDVNYHKGIKFYNTMIGRDMDTPITDADVNLFFRDIPNTFVSSNPRFSFIDLFAGIGGFRLAMQNFGGQCVFSSEFNPNAKKTYCYNFGEMPFGDITLQETKDIIPQNFDVLCGGFPCQAFSIAGLRKGFEDTRGTLFFDVAEIIKEHQPKAVFLENVKNLESHDSGKTFSIIKQTLEELGYAVYHKILKSSEYANIPQCRERILIVAFNKNKVSNYSKFAFPNPIPLTKTIHDCIESQRQDEKYYYRANQRYYTKLVEDMTNPDTIYQWRRIYCRENQNNLCPTLTANMGAGGHNVPLILTEYGIRKLIPKECLNFMGYPKEYCFPSSISESSKYMQAGNSVVVPMMTRVAESIIKVLLP